VRLSSCGIVSPHFGTGGLDPRIREVADFAVVGLPGEGSPLDDDANELYESFVLTLALEKVEYEELTSVLDELPGGEGRTGVESGVEGRDGTGRKLFRLWIFGGVVSKAGNFD